MNIVNVYEGEVRDVLPFEDLDTAKANLPSDMNVMEAPEHVVVGWIYKDGEWLKPVQRGLEWDVETERFYTHEEYRKMLHEKTTNDTLEAMRKIREGDTSIDWKARLDALDAYNLAVEATKEQEVPKYPEYPLK